MLNEIYNDYSAIVFPKEKFVCHIHTSLVELLMIDFELRIIGNFILFIYTMDFFLIRID